MININKSESTIKYYFAIIMTVLCWTFSTIAPRYMENIAHNPWQFLFYRGVGILFSIIIFQAIFYRINFIKNLKKIKVSEFFGGVCLSAAMIFYILGITNTTVAAFMFTYSLTPLVTALISWFFLKEKINLTTFLALIFAFFGGILIIGDSISLGLTLGVFFAFLSMIGFSSCVVFIRFENNGGRAQHILVSGYIVSLIAIIIILSNSINFFDFSDKNIVFSLLSGWVVGVGFMFFSVAARYFLATELVFFAQLEIILTILVSIIPIFGINESISTITFVGGLIMITSIVFHTINKKRIEKKLNARLK